MALVFAPANLGENQSVLIQQNQVDLPLTAVKVFFHNGQPLVSQPFRGPFLRVAARVFITAK